MKKILFGILVLLLSACSNEDIMESLQQEERNTVELTMSVNVPDASSARSFGETATVTSLYLIVFDKQGYLAESAQATDFQTNGDETSFKVTLHQTTNKRIIHFIANYEVGNLDYGSESEIIGKMSVSGDQDAYWQRVELETGIANDDVTAAKMKRVPLLRNFAKITVDVDPGLSDFQFEGFAVVNTLNKGTVAPYNTGGGGFANFISGEACLSYSAITQQGYAGFVPGDATINSELPASDDFQTTPYYMYERKHPGDNTTTYILLKGRYKGNTSTYYKLDMVYNTDGVLTYYNLLRNFWYKVVVNSVTGDGYSTIKEAALKPANNNFSGSVLTKSLLNISDGHERLLVSFTDTTVVNTDRITLKYKYIPDIASGTADNGAVKLDFVKPGEVISSVGSLSGPDSQGYNSIEITPKAPGDLTLTQTVTLIGGGLSRDVTFTLRKEQIMRVSCPTSVSASVKTPVDVYIKIPNGLSKTLFPLTFLIETDALSLYPKVGYDYMPVKVGESIIPSKKGTSSFGFEKELTYEKYEKLVVKEGTKEIVCHFLTNKENSASTIYVYNKYFNLGSASFNNKLN